MQQDVASVKETVLTLKMDVPRAEAKIDGLAKQYDEDQFLQKICNRTLEVGLTKAVAVIGNIEGILEGVTNPLLGDLEEVASLPLQTKEKVEELEALLLKPGVPFSLVI